MAKTPLDDLADCIKKAHHDKVLIDQCETTFKAAGGTVGVQEGGKVFGFPGSPDELITEGGKVFQHKA